MDGDRGLRGRVRTEAGEVAYGVHGEGPPVVLVHGTPSRSLIWRGVARRLAGRYAGYVYDLPGFGEAEGDEGQAVSIAAQGRRAARVAGASGREGAGRRGGGHRGGCR